MANTFGSSENHAQTRIGIPESQCGSRAISAGLVVLALGFMLGVVAPMSGRSSATGAARTDCFSVKSQILGRSVPYCVLLPPSYDVEKTRRYPALYVLHGLGDNDHML